jgi:hypothetical protein
MQGSTTTNEIQLLVAFPILTATLTLVVLKKVRNPLAQSLPQAFHYDGEPPSVLRIKETSMCDSCLIFIAIVYLTLWTPLGDSCIEAEKQSTPHSTNLLLSSFVTRVAK